MLASYLVGEFGDQIRESPENRLVEAREQQTEVLIWYETESLTKTRPNLDQDH